MRADRITKTANKLPLRIEAHSVPLRQPAFFGHLLLVLFVAATALSSCDPGYDTGADASQVITDRMRSENSKALQLEAGGTTGFLLRGPIYNAIDRVRVMRFEPPAKAIRTSSVNYKKKYTAISARQDAPKATAIAKASPDAFARIGRKTKQGRWVSFAAPKTSPTGLYWIEAYSDDIKEPLLAIPVVAEVVAHPTRIERHAKIPSIIDVMSTVADDPGDDTESISTVSLTGNFLAAVDPACYLAAEVMQGILEHGATPPCQGGVGLYLGESNARIISHYPRNVGETEEILQITGRHLPNEDYLSVILDAQALEVTGGDFDNLYARLPSDPTSGRLLVKRKSTDEVLAELDAEYQVVAAAEPDTSLFGDFDGSAATVTWRRGYQLAMLSWIVYFGDLDSLFIPEDTFRALLGIDLVDTRDITLTDPEQNCNNASGSMQWATFDHAASNTFIVSLRGSQTGSAFQDWTDSDLDSRELGKPQWAPGAIVHCGFHQAAKVVFDESADEIRDAFDNGKNIWLTGHSLGGSSAEVLAAMLEWDSDIGVDAVYTFGSPPIGNQAFVNALDDRVPVIHRFEIEHDPVVSFGYDAGFIQAGTAHRLYGNGDPGLNAASGFNSYPGINPIQMVLDLTYAHMEYWCRIFAEYDESEFADLKASVLTPPQNPEGGYNCDINDFYGELTTTF